MGRPVPKNLRIALPLAALFLFFALRGGGGFLVALLLPFLLVYTISNLIRMVRRPEERAARGVRLAIWIAAFAIAAALQASRSAGSRSAAEAAARRIAACRDITGRYPASLGEAGLDEAELRNRWRLSYSVREGKPLLAYPAAFMPLTLQEYDFERRSWRTNAY